jgi:outer membrane porin, OprD family
MRSIIMALMALPADCMVITRPSAISTAADIAKATAMMAPPLKVTNSSTMASSGIRGTMGALLQRACLALVLMFASLTSIGPAAADDAPPPPPGPPIERLFAPLKEAMKDLPPFLRDTDLKLHFRSYYFNRENPEGTENEAGAFGGWASYKSGWLFDAFGIGATIYGSGRLYGPEDKDGTLLLKPGQKGYGVLGEAYAALRYQDYILVKGYRQLVNQPYINPIDNRMTPNTFEGITAGGKVDVFEYLAGYLWKIKPRNEDRFISMSKQAGAAGSDDGVILGRVQVTPLAGLRIDAAEQYGINTFNTVYLEGDYLTPLDENWKLRLGAQFTDQRAVGDELVANAAKRNWSTQHGGGRIQALYRDLTLTSAFSITGSGNSIQSPWGNSPNYTLMMDRDFNRANEKAVLFGAAYDFSKLVAQGLSANFNFAAGWHAIDPKTRTSAPDQREYNLTVDARPPWLRPAFLQGWWLRVRGGVLDQERAGRLGWQVRVILNWDRDLL